MTDPETGRWKEVYYTLSGDGKTYTLFMDHFTAGTEESDREITLEDGTRIAANFTYENGKSIFDYVFREGAQKYENTSHYLYNVGVIRPPDLEKFLSHDSRRAVQILNGLVTKSGGVPAEAGLSESSSCFGDTVDDMSFNSTVLSLFPLAKDLSDVNSGGGLVLGVLGIGILALRLSDQLSRGVGWDKIGSSNAWGFASAAVGVLGLPFFGLPTVGIALAGCGIYVCSKIGAAQSKEEREKRILQNPRTIEEGAYDCFLYEYTRQIPEYVVLNDPAYEGVRGNCAGKCGFHRRRDEGRPEFLHQRVLPGQYSLVEAEHKGHQGPDPARDEGGCRDLEPCGHRRPRGQRLCPGSIRRDHGVDFPGYEAENGEGRDLRGFGKRIGIHVDPGELGQLRDPDGGRGIRPGSRRVNGDEREPHPEL